MVKMCPRKACGLEPQHCLCCCDDCGALLRGLKRCKRKGCTFGANRSPEVTTPPQESPPRPRLPSKPSPSLSPPRARRALCYTPPMWPNVRSPGPDHWTYHCPCEWCPQHHFRPHRVLGLTVWHAAYRAHRAAGILPGHPLWGLSPEARKTRLLEMRQQREQQQQLHFMENPAVWSAPSSVLDHFTKDWLMYRLSTGKVSEKSKRHQLLAKVVTACSCHYMGQVLLKHNAVARASTTESPSGSSQSVPSPSVSSTNGIAGSARGTFPII